MRSSLARHVCLLAILVAGCEDTTPDRGPAPVAAASEVSSIAPWEPVDPAFAGCAGACGAVGQDADARTQPGVAVGDLTYCPVSGAVFTVSAESPTVDVEGEAYQFCCDACAAYFTENRERVLAARRLRSGATAQR
jgi:hypothetical protein